jgi:hypothetical protein
MKKLSRVVLVAVLVVGAGVWLWGVFFPNPEKVIRARLKEIESLVSFPANQKPLTSLTEVQRLCSFVSPDVEVRVEVPGAGRGIAHGRQEVREGMLSFRSTVNGAKVEFPDISVNVASDRQSAEALLTVRAHLPSEPDGAILEMKLAFQKLDGNWLIMRAETMKTLR